MEERLWTDNPLSAGETLTLGPNEITRSHDTVSAFLVTGGPPSALADMVTLGLGDDVQTQPFAICISRDTYLVVGDPNLVPGWFDGSSIADATGAWVELRIAGPDRDLILAQGTSTGLKTKSRSAAVQFAGLTCLLIRRGDAASLWVPAAYLTYVTSFLRRVVYGSG